MTAERVVGRSTQSGSPGAGHIQRLRERAARAADILRAPRVSIALYGGDEARLVYDAFTAPHPRFRVVPAKSYGVALIRVPDSYDDHVKAVSRSFGRRVRDAEAKGYSHLIVSPDTHLDEILEINCSAPARQGRPMDSEYVDPEGVARTFAGRQSIHAVTDARGRIRAYALTPLVGDVVVLSVILGHADHLRSGAMYLLVAGIVRTAIAQRRRDGRPAWVLYDTFWGASSGLAEFKTRLGFRPYTVDWVWATRAVDGGAGT